MDPHGGHHGQYPQPHYRPVNYMKLLARLHSTLKPPLLQRNALATQLDEELRFHIEARTADLIDQGISPEGAARRARLELGDINTYRDQVRHSLGLRWFDDFIADLRYATRILRKNLAFAAIAVGSLALAIGANTAIFSVANEALYERLASRMPSNFVSFSSTETKT